MATHEISIGDVLTVLNGDAIVGHVQVVRADNAQHTNGIALKAHTPMCDACGKNEAGEYTTNNGANICTECVHRVLVYRVAHAVLDDVAQFDAEMARAISILDDDDSAMRAGGISYVDSHASAWDMMRGENTEARVQYLASIVRLINDACASPGDASPDNTRMAHSIYV